MCPKAAVLRSKIVKRQLFSMAGGCLALLEFLFKKSGTYGLGMQKEVRIKSRCFCREFEIRGTFILKGSGIDDILEYIVIVIIAVCNRIRRI